MTHALISGSTMLPAKNLTSGQSQVLNELQSFFNGSSNCYILKGYAGTGKTFLLSLLSRWLNESGISFRLMAPTGRAAKILTAKTEYNASTIHKAIYNMRHMAEYQDADAEGDITFKYYYSLNKTSGVFITIVDEASMVTDSYSHAEFFRFGSGYLLKDLLEYSGVLDPASSSKILFAGDPAQLPPVKALLSPALDKYYLKEKYGLDAHEYELTEVIRQKRKSAVLSCATDIRNSIKENTFNQFHIPGSEEEIVNLTEEDAVSKYIQLGRRSKFENSIIIAYKNSTVKVYNSKIRSLLYDSTGYLQRGDKIIITNNNYSFPVELLNGTFAEVTWAADKSSARIVQLFKTEGIKSVTLQFRDIKMKLRHSDGSFIELHCKIIENLLNSDAAELEPDEVKALYLDFKQRHKTLFPGTAAYKNAMITDPYFNAVRIKYGYAITCHKAQGGEWENVFVDFSSSGEKLSEAYFRWAYTAVTRSSKKLFTINVPSYGLFSESFPDIEHHFSEHPEIGSELSVHGGSEPPKKSLANIKSKITVLETSNKIKLLNVQNINSGERLLFTRRGATAVIDILTDEDGFVREIIPMINKSSSQELVTEIEAFLNIE